MGKEAQMLKIVSNTVWEKKVWITPEERQANITGVCLKNLQPTHTSKKLIIL